MGLFSRMRVKGVDREGGLLDFTMRRFNVLRENPQ
jgi:hypothetical protein